MFQIPRNIQDQIGQVTEQSDLVEDIHDRGNWTRWPLNGSFKLFYEYLLQARTYHEKLWKQAASDIYKHTSILQMWERQMQICDESQK